MPNIRGHGGGCCGFTTIAGFGDGKASDKINVEQLPGLVSRVANGRNIEIVLAGYQMRNLPNTLELMAKLGFVLVGHYINNNHGSDNYVFHRADRRRPLTGVKEWKGMIQEPGLKGDLPFLNGKFPKSTTPPPTPYRVDQNRGFQRGQRVQVNSPRSRRHNQEFNIVYFATVYDSYGYARRVAQMRDETGLFNISLANLVAVGPAIAPAEPPKPKKVELEIPLHQHVTS